jgi:hypothetical protein
MRAKLFTHAVTSDAFDRGEMPIRTGGVWLRELVGQAAAVQRRSSERVITARAWLARTHAARVTGNTVRRFRRAQDYAGAARRVKKLEARAKNLEAENERLRTALQAYQRAAYLTLTQSNGVLGNRVRIDGQWHDLERKLPWYRMAVDELDFVHACVRKLIGERQFATARPGEESGSTQVW